MSRHGRRDEAGSALIEAVWLSILLLVPLVYVVLAVFTVQRAAYGVSAAAEAAGRAFTLAPDEGTAGQRARAAAAVALTDHGVDAAPEQVTISCAPDPRNCLAPGSVITVLVDASVDLPLMPDVLGPVTPTIAVDAEHRLPYGTFREDR
ncbi:hypothetical protein [Nocardioides massiliensis]|uniref:Flp pilus assembly protein TadG n=1 Tax=Nocardioides massiliensis TaxID=1325935 RepID=A0ABT9NIX7_9ACTN|nr:hypothetical protein [Nocardioides massiliensis]MDP9820359.1 Flp pilus assembly protein TadG [Nocardioides massiliensis]